MRFTPFSFPPRTHSSTSAACGVAAPTLNTIRAISYRQRAEDAFPRGFPVRAIRRAGRIREVPRFARLRSGSLNTRRRAGVVPSTTCEGTRGRLYRRLLPAHHRLTGSAPRRLVEADCSHRARATCEFVAVSLATSSSFRPGVVQSGEAGELSVSVRSVRLRVALRTVAALGQGWSRRCSPSAACGPSWLNGNSDRYPTRGAPRPDHHPRAGRPATATSRSRAGALGRGPCRGNRPSTALQCGPRALRAVRHTVERTDQSHSFPSALRRSRSARTTLKTYPIRFFSSASTASRYCSVVR